MSKENSQRDYWSSNLDVKNLGGGDSLRRFNLEEELDFYFSPEQLFALKKLWGEEGLCGKRILEIGGGMGVFALFLATQEADVYVADIAPARIYFLNRQAQARGLASRIHAVCAAAESLPFADDFFDAVYTKSVLIHTELEKAAREAARVLKKGGRGIFVEPMAQSPLVNIYRRTLAPKEWRTLANYFDRQRLGVLMRAFGGGRIRYFYLFAFMAFFWQFGWRNRALFKFFANALNDVDEFLFRLLPPLKRLAWFAVVSVKK